MGSIVIALLLLLPQTPDLFRTAGTINGNAWVALSEREKGSYLLGFFEGTVAFQLSLAQDTSVTATQDALTAARKRLEPRGTSLEVMKHIDTFYSDTANARIPVIFAFQHVLKRLNGAPAKELEEYVTSLRKRFSE
jgi:hypothetical protein